MQNNITGIKPKLDAIITAIIDTVPVEAIYLFGSYAYGTPNQDSDFDLYLIFKDDMQMRELDAIDAARMAILPIQKMPLDLLGLKANRFADRRNYATLERKIAREGIKLYG